MQELKKYFKLLLYLSMFLSLPLFAKKALMPIVMDDIVVMVSYTIPKPIPFPYRGRVKKTGQTKSYDDYGDVVTDGSIKDDGYYQKGITPKYSRSNEIVTDYITGLQWQDNAEAKTITRDSEDAKAYCNNLNLGGGGWRLPTIVELQSILMERVYNPSVDTAAFMNYSTSFYYLSSTTIAHNISYVLVTDFWSGDTNTREKSYIGNVRCVR